MLEYVGLSIVLPFVAALLAMLLLRLRLSVLAILGAGHAGGILATIVRSTLDIGAMHSLGLFDPFLSVAVGALLVLLVLRLIMKLRGPRIADA